MEVTIEEALQQGIAAHKAGNLEEAERLYRAIIGSAPTHSDANHNLGVLALGVGKVDTALPYFRTALEASPNHGRYWVSYVDALISLGRPDDAGKVLEQGKKAADLSGDVITKLESRLSDSGKVEKEILNVIKMNADGDTKIALERALLLVTDWPINFVLLFVIASIYKKINDFPRAIEFFNRALLVKNDSPETLNELAVLNSKVKNSYDSLHCLKVALIIKPDYAEANNNMGRILTIDDKYTAAIKILQRAILIRNGYAAALNNLAFCYLHQTELEKALKYVEQSINLDPNNSDAVINKGAILGKMGDHKTAIIQFEKSIQLKTGEPIIYYNLAQSLNAVRRFDEAVRFFRKALILSPEFFEAYNDYGNAQRSLGFHSLALKSYNRTIILRSDFVKAHSNKNLCLNYSSQWSADYVYEQHLNFDRQFGEVAARVSLEKPTDKGLNRPLRVGYISGDFRKHSVAYFFEPLLANHRPENVETFCYYNHSVVDEVTERLMQYSDHWRSINDVDDHTVIKRIGEDKIDILVDLSGHTAKNRLRVFSYKPAPIQASWLGYPNTTGLKAIDYRFTDIIADPLGEADKVHAEILFRLPNGFQCYKGDETVSLNTELPYEENGFITFGSFNNLSKVTPEVIKVWSKILNAVPHSRLLLKAEQLTHNKMHYSALVKKEGIAEERIVLHGYESETQNHLGLYSLIDVGLDPFPFNGATTTCEALWMGVPIITLLGNRHVGRVGASILSNIGLNDFIAQDIDTYIEIATKVANDVNYLKDVRKNLRMRMQNSPLCDGFSFAKDIEVAYQDIWNRYTGNKI